MSSHHSVIIHSEAAQIRETSPEKVYSLFLNHLLYFRYEVVFFLKSDHLIKIKKCKHKELVENELMVLSVSLQEV